MSPVQIELLKPAVQLGGKNTLSVCAFPYPLHQAPLQRVRSAAAHEGDKRAGQPNNVASRAERCLPSRWGKELEHVSPPRFFYLRTAVNDPNTFLSTGRQDWLVVYGAHGTAVPDFIRRPNVGTVEPPD